MKHAIIENGIVINVVVADNAFESNWVPADDTAQIGGSWDGKVFGPVMRTAAEVRAEVELKAQNRLDNFAHTRGYSSMLSLCTYAASNNPAFAAEGAYGVQARDATWAKCYEILADVQSGTRPLPSGYSEIEPELPALAWLN
jgi:hypothetical protein